MVRLIQAFKTTNWSQSPRARWAVAACALVGVIVAVFAGPWLRKHPSWLLFPLAVAGILVLLGCVFIFPGRFVPPRPPDALEGITDPRERIRLEDERLKLQNDVRTALLQAFGGAAVLAGIFFTWQQLQTDRNQLQNQLIITRQGQIADRFTQAINQLASKQPDVRLGGIYGLEAIAKQSPEARLQVFEVLGAYIRKYSVPRPAPPSPSSAGTAKNATSTTVESVSEQSERLSRYSDIETILVVLSRRDRMPSDPLLDLSNTYIPSDVDIQGLDLSNVDFSGSRIDATLDDVHLEGANLQSVQFWEGVGDLARTHLERSNLKDAKMKSLTLDGIYLNEANLQGAELYGSRLLNAHLEKADLQDADLGRTVLTGANFKNACLNGANLGEAEFDGATLTTGATEGPPMHKGRIRDDSPTIWPEGFDWRAAGVVTRPCPIRESDRERRQLYQP